MGINLSTAATAKPKLAHANTAHRLGTREAHHKIIGRHYSEMLKFEDQEDAHQLHEELTKEKFIERLRSADASRNGNSITK